jgi:hypothetical protein
MTANDGEQDKDIGTDKFRKKTRIERHIRLESKTRTKWQIRLDARDGEMGDIETACHGGQSGRHRTERQVKLESAQTVRDTAKVGDERERETRTE